MWHDPGQDEQRSQKPAPANSADLKCESSDDPQNKRPSAGYDDPKKGVPQVELHPRLAKEGGEIIQPNESLALGSITKQTCTDDRVGRVHREENGDGHAG